MKDKVSLQNRLQPKAIISFKKISIVTYFENLIIRLHILYTLNIYVKFCANKILFTICSSYEQHLINK